MEALKFGVEVLNFEVVRQLVGADEELLRAGVHAFEQRVSFRLPSTSQATFFVGHE